MVPSDKEVSEESIISDTNNISVVVNEVIPALSKIKLNMEELLASENEASRQGYLSPRFSLPSSPTAEFLEISVEDSASIASSVSSGFVSVIDRSIQSSIQSGRASISSAALRAQTDPFNGVDDDDFAHLDRYGFLLITRDGKVKVNEKSFLEVQRKTL